MSEEYSIIELRQGAGLSDPFFNTQAEAGRYIEDELAEDDGVGFYAIMREGLVSAIFCDGAWFVKEDDWMLLPEQFVLMQRNHEVIVAGMRGNATADEVARRNMVADSLDFKHLFGSMSFDEAFDRYETMLQDRGVVVERR